MGVWVVVIFVLCVMRVVGGVPLWVECLFVSVVHPVAILRAVICVICSLCLMLVVKWWKRTKVGVLLWLFMLR